MKQATEIFEKHWTKATGKPLDETTKELMMYAIEAINEALSYQSNNMITEFINKWGAWLSYSDREKLKQEMEADLKKLVSQAQTEASKHPPPNLITKEQCNDIMTYNLLNTR